MKAISWSKCGSEANTISHSCSDDQRHGHDYGYGHGCGRGCDCNCGHGHNYYQSHSGYNKYHQN